VVAVCASAGCTRRGSNKIRSYASIFVRVDEAQPGSSIRLVCEGVMEASVGIMGEGGEGNAEVGWDSGDEKNNTRLIQWTYHCRHLQLGGMVPASKRRLETNRLGSTQGWVRTAAPHPLRDHNLGTVEQIVLATLVTLGQGNVQSLNSAEPVCHMSEYLSLSC
jgi:hypothetical protein